MPFKGKLRNDNRWVKLAKFIPWDEFEPEYAKAASKSNLGPPGKSVRIEKIKKASESKSSSKDNDEKNNDDDSGEASGSNRGKLIIDATCTPADITFPTDLKILNTCRENARLRKRISADSAYRGLCVNCPKHLKQPSWWHLS